MWLRTFRTNPIKKLWDSLALALALALALSLKDWNFRQSHLKWTCFGDAIANCNGTEWEFVPALWNVNNETSEKLLFPNFLDGPWFNGLLKERRRRGFRIGRCSPASGRVPQIPNSPQARSRRRSCYTAYCWYGSSACAPALVLADLCWYYVHVQMCGQD